MSVSKGMVTAVLAWLENVEALGFTPEQIDKLADEYLEVQGTIPPKHGMQFESTAYYGNKRITCYCRFQGTPKEFDRHLDDMAAPTISTYVPSPEKEHKLRGDSIGMGLHERWYCSCGTVYNTRSVAERHAEFANASF